jgi:hypothetical protein
LRRRALEEAVAQFAVDLEEGIKQGTGGSGVDQVGRGFIAFHAGIVSIPAPKFQKAFGPLKNADARWHLT